MKLSYRGITYKHHSPVVETAESKVVGKYRGVQMKLHNPISATARRRKHERVYRGVHY